MDNFSTANQNNNKNTSNTSLVTTTSTYKDDCYYNMNHSKQGIAYIFSHEVFQCYPQEKRNGAEVEARKLKNCLHNLGFHVHPFKDLKVAEIIYHIDQARKMDHTNNNCFLVAVLSHGIGNKVAALDEIYDPREVLWDQFTADKCPTLAGKPKLFFMQCCLGQKLDAGCELLYTPLCKTETDGRLKTLLYTIPTYSDFCIVYATSKDHCAFRNDIKGSYFITVLCEELEKNAFQEHLLTILTFVIRRVAVEFESKCRTPEKSRKKQAPYFECSLTRLVKFIDNRNKNGSN